MNTTVKIESQNYKYANTFSGTIEPIDFEFLNMSLVTDRIIHDRCFDRQCRRDYSFTTSRQRYRESHVYKLN